MPAQIQNILLREADDSSAVRMNGQSVQLQSDVLKFEITERLDKYGRQPGSTSTMELNPHSPIVWADPPVLTHRRLVRVNYTNRTEEFRITKFIRNVSLGSNATLQLEPLWMDLASSVSRQVINQAGTDKVDLEWYIVGRTPEEALQEIMARGQVGHFLAGDVASAFSSASVYLHCIGNTPLDMIRRLCESITEQTGLRAEWDIERRSRRRGGYAHEVKIVEKVGGTITHPIEGHTDGSRWNRQMMRLASDATKFFTRVVPIGGPDGETGGIGSAEWTVESITGNTLTLENDPIYVSGAPQAGILVAKYVDGERESKSRGGWDSAIVRTTTPDQVTVANVDATKIRPGDRVRFMDESSELVYLADGPAEESAHIKERLLRRSDIPPFANILDTVDVSTDLSTWSGGLPVGVTSHGGNITISQVTSELAIAAGSSAMRMEADDGDYIESAAFTLDGDGYTSVWTRVLVDDGVIKLALVDQNGKQYPGDLSATAAADESLRGLSIGGLKPENTAGTTYKVRITALEDGTDASLDAWTVTRSATPYEYAQDMGPVALWNAAGALLSSEGGFQPNRIETNWIDLSRIEGYTGIDRPLLGATVTVKDAGVSESVRISEMTRTITAGNEIIKGKLGTRAPDFEDFLTKDRRRPITTRIPPHPLVKPDSVRVIRDDQREKPVIVIIYGPEIKAIRLEVPITTRKPTIGVEYVYNSNWYVTPRSTTAPVPSSTASVVSTTIGVKTWSGDDLSSDGGEVRYVVNDDMLDNNRVEQIFRPQEVRGEYRVFSYTDANDDNTASLAWSGVMKGIVEPPYQVVHEGIERLIAYPDASGNERWGYPILSVRINNARATLGTLVWRVNEGAWTVVSARERPTGTIGPTITENPTTPGSWYLSFWPPYSGTDSVYASLACRRGDGTISGLNADPYEYLGIITIPMPPENIQPAQTNILVTEKPASANGAAEGTLFCKPV